ncbi:MAG: Trk system potassium transporter TrkA, partial [Clostridia bacterium]|nr:Trk system potassium transporter TrkA [Clostridia bacterium]
MKIIVCGCGKIGTSLLSSLASEGHDLLAIDKDPAAIAEVTNIYDVIGVCGNAADCETLEDAGIRDTDLFIAVTSSDELNMLACFLAGRMSGGRTHTIARIRNPEYNDASLDFMRRELGLSMAINPELLAARELFDILRMPSAVNIDAFSGRSFEIVELILKEDSVLDGITLQELRNTYQAPVLVCTVQRGDEVMIPRGGTFTLRAGDRIGITATPAEISKFLRQIGLLQKKARRVMLLGGSRTAFYLAKLLTANGVDVKIIEQDPATAEDLAEKLPGVSIVLGDGAQQELLLEEGLRETDAFVALTGMDEENILISICAASQKVPKVISKINRDELSSMAEKLGLDSFISPRRIISDVLVQYARALENSQGTAVETLYKLNDGRAEALEFFVKDPIEGVTEVPIIALGKMLKPNILIAGIIRSRKTIVPGPTDMIHPGDRVIVLAGGGHRLSDLG